MWGVLIKLIEHFVSLTAVNESYGTQWDGSQMEEQVNTILSIPNRWQCNYRARISGF
jgi:hypothetical protein